MRSWPQARAQAPAGGHRAAARLASRTGLAVEKPDIEGLAATRCGRSTANRAMACSRRGASGCAGRSASRLSRSMVVTSGFLHRNAWCTYGDPRVLAVIATHHRIGELR